MTFGDLGADVIKVERPRDGDETRGWGPPFDERGESAYYLSVNRNKLSVALDLDSPSDRQVLLSLISRADVVLDNFRPGTLARRGLDPDPILVECPRLVWCTITGFGDLSERPGYDFVVQAESGWMAVTGDADGAPMKVGIALADVIAGKDTVITVLATLAARDSLGAAERRRSVSLAHSATAALVNVAQNVLVSGRDAPRWGNAHPNLVPYQLFHAADRPIVIAVGSDAQWRACCSALGLTDLGGDERFAANAGRLEHRTPIVAAFARRIASRPASDWLGALQLGGVPCGIVRSVRESLVDVPASPLTGVAPAAGGSVRLPPPTLDEHGALVRAYGWEAFSRLETSG
jgi:crotonobetainyl-CoA:carnitine CoA-transferase CaiB-like acyl-CoA transferase